MGSHNDNNALHAVVDSRQDESLGLGLCELVALFGSDIGHASGRPGERESAVLGAADPRADNHLPWVGRIKSHVGLFRVFAEPGEHEGIALCVRLLIKDHDHATDITRSAPCAPYKELALAPASDGLAHVDSIFERRDKGMSHRPLLAKDRLATILHPPTESLDHDVLWRIGANSVPGKAGEELAGETLPAAAFHGKRSSATSGPRDPRAEPDASRAEQQLLAGDSGRGEVGQLGLNGIGRTESPELISEALIHTASARDHEVEQVGN